MICGSRERPFYGKVHQGVKRNKRMSPSNVRTSEFFNRNDPSMDAPAGKASQIQKCMQQFHFYEVE